MESQYWIRRNDRTAGPFTSEQIRQMASSGMLSEADHISDDQIQFQPAGGVGGLFSDPKPTPPPVPTSAAESPVYLQPDQDIVTAVLVDTPNRGDTIHFRCRNCGKPVRAEKKWAGRKFKCPSCGYTDNIRSPQTVADTYVMICDGTRHPAKRPVRMIIWAVVSMILGCPAGIFMFQLAKQAESWSPFLGMLVFFLMAFSGGLWMKKDVKDNQFGYFLGMAYAVLSIALFFLRVILIPSEFPPDHELRELMPMMIAVAALFYLLYPIITIAVLHSRPVRKYLRGTPMPQE